jgi:hypothetical protein
MTCNKQSEVVDGLLQMAGVQATRVRAHGTRIAVDAPYDQRGLVVDVMNIAGFEITGGPGRHLDGTWGWRQKFRVRKSL